MAPRLSGEQLPVQQGNSIHSGRDTRGTTLGGGKRQDLTPASPASHSGVPTAIPILRYSSASIRVVGHDVRWH